MNSVKLILFQLYLVILFSVEGLLTRISGRSWDNISLGDVTSCFVRSSSSWVLIVMRDGSNLFLLASRGRRAIHRSVSSRAFLPLAVYKDWTICTSARWEISKRSGNLERIPLSHRLSKVERFSFHLNVFSKIFIAVHTGGE